MSQVTIIAGFLLISIFTMVKNIKAQIFDFLSCYLISYQVFSHYEIIFDRIETVLGESDEVFSFGTLRIKTGPRKSGNCE